MNTIVPFLWDWTSAVSGATPTPTIVTGSFGISTVNGRIEIPEVSGEIEIPELTGVF